MSLTISAKQATDEVLKCIQVGLTPLITSAPGMGKSSLVAAVAKDYNLKLIDLRLSQCTPEDLQGFPMRNPETGKATFTPFDIFPLKGEPLPVDENGNEMQGWLLFLDELPTATKPVQAAAYKLILDRMVGSFHLHDHVATVAAGNRSADKAIVNPMSTALQSRLVHFEMDVNPDEWIEMAFKMGIDHRVISFISYMPSKLMDFRPDHSDKTFACPRTWEFVSRLVKDEEITYKMMPRLAGTIGEGMAVEFSTFAEEFGRLPKFADIVKDPANTILPPEASTKYATMGMLIEHADDKSMNSVLDYVARFDVEMQILFCRGASQKNKKLRGNHQKFDAFLSNMVRYLDAA